MTPSSLRTVAGRAFRALPEEVRLRVAPGRLGYKRSDIPQPVRVPQGRVRLYVAPANSAGQGWAWARAAETLDGVGAVDMQIRRDRDFGYPTDYAVPQAVVAHSETWGRRQFAAVCGGFTHVLAESHVPLFGRRFGDHVVTERRALQREGVLVAAVSHGSDVRLPSRHRVTEPWSPFRDDADELTRALERSVLHRSAILDELDGVEFVSTPDLLLDRPRATWLPVVVDPARWEAPPPLDSPRPVIFHAPSAAGLKGTDLVISAVRDAERSGVIALRTPERTPAAQMPALVRSADVVLDQFSLGIYGVAAVEAMAAGRVVVSHVSDFVRDTVRERTGWELPIVEATADTVVDVLADIGERPEHYRDLAANGPAFARDVHDGRRSAETLSSFLGVPAAPGKISL